MSEKTILITGTSRGIGKYLAEYYLKKNYNVIGCSRAPINFDYKNYIHQTLDVGNEIEIRQLFKLINKKYGKLDYLINNAGIAAMNHALLTPTDRIHKILTTNVVGTFVFCREAAKLMSKNKQGRIINFTSVAVPLKVQGEAIYAASKSAVNCLTEILAHEFAEFGITVNGIGPVPVATDLIRRVPAVKLQALIERQAIQRIGEYSDISNVTDFFLQETSHFITGQILYLGGVT